MKKLVLLIGLLLGLAIGYFAALQIGGGSSAPVIIGQQAIAGGNQANAASVDTSHYTVVEVHEGESILDAVKAAASNTTIVVYPGVYKETVYIDKDNIKLVGVIEKSQWPELNGEKIRNDAILYSGNNVSIENFKISDYKGNGIMGQAGNNFIIRNNWIVDTGVYGIFPEFGTNGLIEHNVLTGIEDAAIYVGMSDHIVVRHNDVYGNVAGIEIENSRHALVENNYVHDNAGGILAFITPGLPIKTCYDVVIRNNFIDANNHVNFAAPGSIVSFVPSGTGIIVMAADDVTIEGNIISNNKNVGIVISDLSFISSVASDPESEPNPDRMVILDNFMTGNGAEPIEEVKALMMTQFTDLGPDIIDTMQGSGSCILNKGRYRTFGLGGYTQCETTSTAGLDYANYMLPEPVPPREIPDYELGKNTYYGVCAGCHAYNVRMIGPPAQVVQALYMNNPDGIVEYARAPVHKRDDYPEMPPQDYLPPEALQAAAEFMLELKK